MDVTIRVSWIEPNADFTWNELLAWAAETYGLPGDRWTYNPSKNYMFFNFKDENDSLLFQLKTAGKRMTLEDLILYDLEQEWEKGENKHFIAHI